MWLEPIFDSGCNVMVNLYDLDLEDLLKVNEYRTIRQEIQILQQEEMEENMKRNR